MTADRDRSDPDLGHGLASDWCGAADAERPRWPFTRGRTRVSRGRSCLLLRDTVMRRRLAAPSSALGHRWPHARRNPENTDEPRASVSPCKG